MRYGKNLQPCANVAEKQTNGTVKSVIQNYLTRDGYMKLFLHLHGISMLWITWSFAIVRH